MKNVFTLLFFFLYSGLNAQQDTIYEGREFHVRIYDDSDKVACIGNYLPNTGIRTGEWDYFYSDGKLYARTYFNKDIKTGLWIYYDEQGNITRDEKYHHHLFPIRETNLKSSSYFYYDPYSHMKNNRMYPEYSIRRESRTYVTTDVVEDIFSNYYRNTQQNKNACVQFTNGSEPLEYDERLYPFKVNAIAYYTYWQRAEKDAKEKTTRYYVIKDNKITCEKLNKKKKYTNIEIKNGMVRRLKFK